MRKPDPIAMHVIDTTWRAGARFRCIEWAGVLAAWMLDRAHGYRHPWANVRLYGVRR